MDDRYREMVEYYTMWTHQIKTPIAAMHLLLQEEETPVSKELQGELFQVEQYVQMALQYLRMERMNTDLVFEKTGTGRSDPSGSTKIRTSVYPSKDRIAI